MVNDGVEMRIMSGLLVEKSWPYVITLLVVICWFHFLQHHFPNPSDDLMLATGTAAAVLIGFLATAKAIVLGLTSTAVFKALKDTGYHSILFHYFFEAIVFGTGALVISIVGFFLPEPKPVWFAIIWVAIATVALFNFLRVVGFLFKLIKQA